MEIYSFIRFLIFLYGFCVTEALYLYCRGHEGSIILMYNPQSKTAIAIDSQSNVSMVSGLDQGVQFYYDHSKGFGVISHKGPRFRNTQEYISYLQNIQSVQLRKIKGEKFFIRNPPVYVLNMHAAILKSLQTELGDCGEIKREAAFKILIILLKQISALNRSTLRNVIKEKLYLKDVEVEVGFMNVVSVLRGIARFIQTTKGEFEKLILKSRSFNIIPLFTIESASEILAEIAKQINQPNSVVYDVFNDPIKVYAIMREFNGGLYSGMRGVESLACHTILYLKKRISLETFIDHLILVTSFSKPIKIEEVVEKIKHILAILKNKTARSAISGSLAISVKLEIFIKGRLEIVGVDVYDVVQTFLSGLMKSQMMLMLQILHKTTPNYIESVAILVKRMAFFTLSGQGLSHYCGVLPSIKNVIVSRSGMNQPISAQKRILERVRSTYAEKNDTSHLKDALMDFPVVNEIFTEVQNYTENEDQWLNELEKQKVLESIISLMEYQTGDQKTPPSGCIHSMGLWGINGDGCDSELI